MPSEVGLTPASLAILVSLLLLCFLLGWTAARAVRRRHSTSGGTALQQTRSLLEGVVEDAADAILVLDRAGRIRIWNRGAAETFGYLAEEVVGQGYELLLPPGMPLDPTLSDELGGSGTVRDLRTQRRRKDGTVVEVSLTRSRIRLPEGSEAGSVEILRDITSQRALERELIHTEKMAAVGKIASKVVHEIRNPLGSINLNVDILLETLGSGDASEEGESREILQTIKRETRRLSQITSEYLQFSRMPQSSGGEGDINEVILELADFLRPELRRSGIRMVLNLAEERPRVACDSRLLRLVVLNLLRNAMDSVPPNSGQVTVVTSTADGEGGQIDVDDNGPGIPGDVLPRIFEPFFTTKQDGTGLGLAVVHQIVEEQGGSVQCDSLVGKGTTFRIRLPRSKPPEEV